MKNLKTFLLLATFFGGFYLGWAQQNFNDALNDSIAADGFLYHKLTKNDSYNSLIDLYSINKREIIRLNPLIRRGFEIGLEVKLPSNENLLKLINNFQTNKTDNPYIVKHQDTKFGISKQYGLSIAYLEKTNPIIRLGLKEGDTIYIPKTVAKNLLVEDAHFYIHQVVKGDTFYSLIKKYNVTKEELISANTILSEGLKLDTYLKIPKVKSDISPRTISVIDKGFKNNKDLKVLILLPFKSSNDSIPFDNISTSSKLRNITTDFYFGAEMAIDSLRKQGVKIQAQVYDTENNIDTINKLFKLHDFSKIDLVVGPLFTKNINLVNQKLVNSGNYILSPFSISATASTTGNSKIVQELPLQSDYNNKVVNYIAEHHTNEKMIIVLDTLPESKLLYNQVLKKLATNKSIDLNSIVVLKPVNNYIKRAFFQQYILPISSGKNWVINLSTNGIVLADVINTLGVFSKDYYDISLFTLNKSDLFNNFDNFFLARLNFCFPSETYIDYQVEEVKAFEKKYLSRYHNLPSENAIKGFDMVYDAIERLSVNQNLLDKSNGITRRMAYQFDYIEEVGTNKILNKGVFLLQYQGLSIKLVE